MGLICFQLLLAAGLPLGRYAWGGAHQVLPRSLRIGSVVATFIYLLSAMIILEAASVRVHGRAQRLGAEAEAIVDREYAHLIGTEAQDPRGARDR